MPGLEANNTFYDEKPRTFQSSILKKNNISEDNIISKAINVEKQNIQQSSLIERMNLKYEIEIGNVLINSNLNKQQIEKKIKNILNNVDNTSESKQISYIQWYLENNPDKLSFFVENEIEDIFLNNKCTDKKTKFFKDIRERHIQNKEDILRTNFFNLYQEKGINIKKEELDELIGQIKEKNCGITYIEIINKFNKRYNINFSKDETTRLISNIISEKKAENIVLGQNIWEKLELKGIKKESLIGKKGKEAKILLLEAGVEEDIIEEYIKYLKQKSKIQDQKKNLEIIRSLSDEEYNNMIVALENGENSHDVMQNIIDRKKVSTSTPENSNTSSIKYSYNESYGIINIPGEETPIILSEEEQKIIKNNPEALENLVNFYNFFKKLNLVGVWKYRKDLILAIGDVNINPNDGDSIKNSELVKFGNKLLTFIANIENDGEQEEIKLNNLNSINLKLKEFSGINSGFSDSRTFNINGEDKFTAYLRKSGIIGGAYFNISKFRENI